MNRIRELRLERNLTQEDLGKIVRVSARSIGFYESGERDPDTTVLSAFADYFNVTVDYLLGRTNVRKPTLPNDVKDIAFHLDVEELSDEGRQQVLDYIEFLKNKYKKKS